MFEHITSSEIHFNIFEVLTLRLKPYAATIFKPTLEAIEDLDRLTQLHRAAILADTLDHFAQALYDVNGQGRRYYLDKGQTCDDVWTYIIEPNTDADVCWCETQGVKTCFYENTGN